MGNSNRSFSLGLAPFKGLWPFFESYRWVIVAAALTLIFTAVLQLSLGEAVRLVVDNGFIAGSLELLNRTLIVLLCVVVLLAGGTYMRSYLIGWIGERVTADIRKSVFNHLITLEPNYFEVNRSGELISRLTADTTLLQAIIGNSAGSALNSVLMVLGGLVMLALTSVKLTLVVFISLPLITLPIFFFSGHIRNLSRNSQSKVADVGAYAGEVLQQIKTVQSYRGENNERSNFSIEVEHAFSVAKNCLLNRCSLASISIFLTFCMMVVMVYIGAIDVINGDMTGGELAAFLFYAVVVGGGVASVSEIFGELQRGVGAAEHLLMLLRVKPEISSPSVTKSMDLKSPIHISLKNVSFSYPSRPDALALNNINIDIKRGETVALVGSSGAGKSTLFELLQRFYDPQDGEVLLNCIPLKEMDLSSARQQMAMVPQQPTLFSSSVMYNIAYGKPDVIEAEVVEAAKLAHAHDFIIKLPKKYGSFLGDQGVRLSGGQKQRLVIARAILSDPEILLLDEATSALDAESELLVQEALYELMKGRTTLIIAHRLATIVHADRILVMDNGKVIAEGTHQQLLETSPLYQKLATLQFSHQDKAG